MAITKNSQIDLNGNEMILDADGDTTITADTDDQIDIKVAGTDTVVISGGAMALKGATPTLTIGDGDEEDAKIIFDGNTVDYHIGLDDSQDDLIIGRDTTLGGHPAIQINADKRVGLGGAPVTQLHVMGGNGVIFDNPNNGYSGLKITDDTSADYNINFLAGRSQGGTKFKFFRYGRDQNTTPWSDYSSPVEIAHISGGTNYFAGKVFVGKTADNTTDVGIVNGALGYIYATRDGNIPLVLNRKTSDGNIQQFRKDNTTVGIVSTRGGEFIAIGSGDTNLEFNFGSDQVNPSSGTAARDNAIDLGSSSARFDDIYATNGTIQTSDQNEKNTITNSDLGLDFINKLSPKSYKFNGKTRTHYGLIAQDVETVLSDISKSTGDFAGFIKGDISEKQDGSSYRYGLRYGEFIAPLIKALQEADDKIDALTARIETLEGG